jgi:hypothetical protein
MMLDLIKTVFSLEYFWAVEVLEAHMELLPVHFFKI